MKRLAYATVFAAAALLAACASAGGSSDDDDGDSDGVDPADASLVDPPDADPLAPDAGGPGTPDASMQGQADAAPSCSPCQLVSQCGCEGAPDQACDLAGAGMTACRQVLAQGGEESTCADSTSCAAGFGCIGGAGSSSCMRYCGSDAQCDGNGGLCVIRIVDGSNNPIPSPDGPGGVLHTCSQNCDPVASTGCPGGFACEVGSTDAASGARDFSVCRKAGAVAQDGVCTGNPDTCAAGHTCINVSGTDRCLKWCHFAGGSAGCGAGDTCFKLTSGGGDIIVNGITWGVCN